MPYHSLLTNFKVLVLFWYFNFSTIVHILVSIILPCKSLLSKLVQLPRKHSVVSKGVSPKVVTHTYLSFHSAGLMRGDSPGGQ